MKIHCVAGLVLSIAAASAQTVEKLDPALDQLVAPDAAVERVATGFNKWTEGPVWTHSGILLFAEIPGNSIIEWRPGWKAVPPPAGAFHTS